jgi:hypothetical protein
MVKEVDEIATAISKRQSDRALRNLTKVYLKDAVKLLGEAREDIETWMTEEDHHKDEFGQECTSHEVVRKINEFIRSLPNGIYSESKDHD